MNKRTPFLQEIVEDMIENNSTDQQIEDVVKTYNEQQQELIRQMYFLVMMILLAQFLI